MFYLTCNHGLRESNEFFTIGGRRRRKHFCKLFILHVTTVYLQAVFDPAKNVLQYFCKCFSVKHFNTFLTWLHAK